MSRSRFHVSRLSPVSATWSRGSVVATVVAGTAHGVVVTLTSAVTGNPCAVVLSPVMNPFTL